jgi:hypothetical protein
MYYQLYSRDRMQHYKNGFHGKAVSPASNPPESPSDKVAHLYTQEPGSLFVASYYWQFWEVCTSFWPNLFFSCTLLSLVLTCKVYFAGLITNFIPGAVDSVTGRGGPQGCETSRLPYFLNNWLTDGGKVVSIQGQPPFTPRKTPGTHFC